MSTLPTTPTPVLFIGADVAKAEIVLAQDKQIQDKQILTVANTKRAIASWLKTLPAACTLGLQATGRYHLLLADLAHAAGHTVFVLKPQQSVQAPTNQALSQRHQRPR